MAVDLDDLARSLVAGFLSGQVNAKGRAALIVASLIGLGLAGIASLLDGGLRWVLAFGAGAALVVAFGIVLTRAVALRLINRFAPPHADVDHQAVDHQAVVTSALDDADLPDGPLAIVRMLWRLRRGARAEVERLAAIVERLKSDLA